MSAGTNKRARLSPDPYNSNNHHHRQQQQQQQQHSSHHHPTIFPAPSAFSTSVTSAPSSSSNTSSSFRNVSACNRCRIRKNRCDQNLPACTSCEKAGVKCVGFDPITKREIPRTYVYFLESRVSYLEELLSNNNVPFAPPSSDFDLGSKPVLDPTAGPSPPPDGAANHVVRHARARSFNAETTSEAGSEWEQKEESDKLNKLVSNIGMVSVQGASDPRYLGSTSGISFARVVFAAIKSSVNNGRSSKAGSIDSAAAVTSGTSMRDSFFGLQTRPIMKPAPFPDRELGMKLVNLFFEYANCQIPILHRGEFMKLFSRAYAAKDKQRSPRELYLLNIVFAIGAGVILPDSSAKRKQEEATKTQTPEPPVKREPGSPTLKRTKSASVQRQPEEYHASAMMHLETFLASNNDTPEGFGGGLEQLQAILLLASFALLRPVAPGLWYIVGVAVRLAVDLGLHSEDGVEENDGVSGGADNLNLADKKPGGRQTEPDQKDPGRREWMRDFRRRLWWCAYSFDRLVSTCVGRPFGVTDQVITTQWYTVLDDKDITPDGFAVSPHNFTGPSSKRVAHHYLRLRLLQSEILQVLQHRQAQRVHARNGPAATNHYMHTSLSCAFLQPFDGSFHAWRMDIDKRLWEWKENAPLKVDTTVSFDVKFLELNYWQAVIVLYRQSLSVPETLASEKGPHTEVESPLSPHTDDYEDEEDIFLKVAEAGQRVLKLYRQLHRIHLVNYTYLATVHLFMAGIAFLYSIWHSPTVRARLTLEDVDFTVLAGTSVLNDLVEKCPPAEACRDAFERMSKATIKMCQSTTGFGSQVKYTKDRQDDNPIASQSYDKPQSQIPYTGFRGSISRPPPTFDYNLKDLFSESMADMSQNSLGSENSSNSGSHLHRWQASYPYPSPASTTASLPKSNLTSMSQSRPQFRDPSYGASRSQQGYDARLMEAAGPTATNPSGPGSYDPTSTSHSNAANANANNSAMYHFPSTPSSSVTDFDFEYLLQSDNAPMPPSFDSGAGLNLGFDGRNDWVECTSAGGGNAAVGPGQQVGGGGMPDLFAEFFFGGAGQAGGGMGMGMGMGIGVGSGLEMANHGDASVAATAPTSGGWGDASGGGMMEGVVGGAGAGSGPGSSVPGMAAAVDARDGRWD